MRAWGRAWVFCSLRDPMCPCMCWCVPASARRCDRVPTGAGGIWAGEGAHASEHVRASVDPPAAACAGGRSGVSVSHSLLIGSLVPRSALQDSLPPTKSGLSSPPATGQQMNWCGLPFASHSCSALSSAWKAWGDSAGRKRTVPPPCFHPPPPPSAKQRQATLGISGNAGVSRDFPLEGPAGRVQPAGLREELALYLLRAAE